MAEQDGKMQDPDEFWDLTSLIPKRSVRPAVGNAPRRPSDTGAVEIVVPRASSSTVEDVPLTVRPVPSAKIESPPAHPERIYRPEGSLVREVRIYPWQSPYDYYEQFRIYAERLAMREGTECPEVDFFSYMPHYSQMNRAQLAYYLWWRTNFRRGVCLPASHTYLLLYVYELINLDESRQDPKTGQENMLRLWLAYREQYPMLDARLCEWLCDYSLLHALPPPALPTESYRALLSGCRLKEFYVPAGENGAALHTAILLFCNNYDYTKSKFYRPDTSADYDRVLSGAIRTALSVLRERSGTALTDAEGVSTVTRDAFSGAICSYRYKRRIQVDYTSFSHTHELRHVMTDVLKYAENALRAALGIKSRLSVYSLDIPLRERLDAYLRVALPARKMRAAAKKEPERPAYERRYDLPVGEISLAHAAEIEAESWQTTRRLVEAFSEEKDAFNPETGAENAQNAPHKSPLEETMPVVLPVADATAQDVAADVPDTGANPHTSPLLQALGELVDFLPLAVARDGMAQRDFARKMKLMTDAVADKINTVAGDILGDIILEEENGVYAVIPDYLELLKEEGVL